MPPAASMAARAEALNACACTVSDLVISLGEDLHRDVVAVAKAVGLERLERDVVVGLKARVEVEEVQT